MIEIYKSEKNDRYYFRIKTKSGVKISQSCQGFASKSGCLMTIKYLQKILNQESQIRDLTIKK